ncbi:MAG: JAB domain-containing protein [Clostridiales bacterium]|nr:JAB domain-containing protein [Clostridiales bacterium]
MVKEPSLYSENPISTPQDVIDMIANEMKDYDREVFAILNLKSNGQVINMNVCSVGTLNSSMVSPREVFKSSILSNAAAFIAFHNHPSGTPLPSSEDREVTRRLQECGALLDIRMLDHIIVAAESGQMMSFKAEGLLEDGKNMRNFER